MEVGRRSGLVGLLATAALVAWVPAASGANLEYVVSKPKNLRAGGTAFKKANCPNDTQVTGGGVTIIGGNTATAIRSSFPIDDKDGGKTPEDGWLGGAISRSAGDKQMVTVAICSRTGRFDYFVDSLLMATGRTSLHTECPLGTRLAGGGLGLFPGTGAMNNGLAVAASLPVDVEGGPRPEAWRATGINQTMFFAGIETYAICASSGSYEYVHREETAPDGAQFGVATPCPNGTKVTAGGVDAASTSEAVEVARVFPFRDGGREPDDGWQSNINNNNTGAPVDFTTWAVCRD